MCERTDSAGCVRKAEKSSSGPPACRFRTCCSHLFLIVVPPGSPCNFFSRCAGGAFCSAEQICECPSGTTPQGSKCVAGTSGNGSGDFKSVLPGASCTSLYSICTGGSVCLNGFCACPKGTILFTQRCISENRSVGPGYGCDFGTVCTGGSFCSAVYHVCVCPTKQVPNAGGVCVAEEISTTTTTTSASIFVPLGNVCDVLRSICQGGSYCNPLTMICQCAEGFVVKDGMCTTVVTGVVPIGDACTETTTCGNNGVCHSGVCECPPGNLIVNNKCALGIVKPGQHCTSPQVCSGGATCSNGLCVCATKEVISGNKCISITTTALRPPGSSCTLSNECGGGSKCNNGRCLCPVGQVVSSDPSNGALICVPDKVTPGNICTRYSQCIGGSSCNNGRCACPVGQIVQNDACEVTTSTGEPGSSCLDSRNCIGRASCQSGICNCGTAEIWSNGFCTPDSGVGASGTGSPGDSCNEAADCIRLAQCKNGLCECNKGLVYYNGKCITGTAAVPPGSWCGGQIICGGGSYCYNNMCQCPYGQVMRSMQCVPAPVVPPGRFCLNGELCGGGSICRGGQCVCPLGSEQLGSFCKDIARSSLGNCPVPENPELCQLPSCFCTKSGTKIPGGLSPSETPQMIILSFDDAVSDRTITIYKSLFGGKFKNPNGCDIKATFFVSHEWNNYADTQWLYWQGHEIALNSMTHDTIADKPVSRWSSEYDGMRQLLKEQSFVQHDSIRGMRAPQIAIGGNSQYEMMTQQSIMYDNSMSANPGKDGEPYWPQTLDYKISWKCEIEPCPSQAFPGIWEIPINQFYGAYIPEIKQHKRGAMVRAVMTADDTQEIVYDLLMSNFERSYNSNRAPFVLTLNADFLLVLQQNQSILALEKFLTDALAKGDTYVVTAQQAIEWIKNPTPVSSVDRFGPWQCPQRQSSRSMPCTTPRRCGYETSLPTGKHYFTTCATCPSAYPWLNNPAGDE